MKTYKYTEFMAVAVATVIMTAGFAASAHADRVSDRAEKAVRHDISNIDRDQHKLSDLLRKRDDQRYRDDSRGAHRTERDIDHVRMDLRRDRYNLNADRHALDGLRRY